MPIFFLFFQSACFDDHYLQIVYSIDIHRTRNKFCISNIFLMYLSHGLFFCIFFFFFIFNKYFFFFFNQPCFYSRISKRLVALGGGVNFSNEGQLCLGFLLRKKHLDFIFFKLLAVDYIILLTSNFFYSLCGHVLLRV